MGGVDDGNGRGQLDLVFECARTSYSVGKRFGIPVGPLREKLLVHAAEMEGDYHAGEDKEFSDEDLLVFLRSARRNLYREAEKEARRVRAKTRGYSVDDEAYYTLGHLKELLEVYYSAGLLENPPVGFSESVRHEKTDGSNYGNFLATLLDVEIALRDISLRYQDILYLRYGYLAEYTDEGISRLAQSEVRDITGYHWEALRALLGDSGEEVGRRCRQALSALQRRLGGRSPWTSDEVYDALQG